MGGLPKDVGSKAEKISLSFRSNQHGFVAKNITSVRQTYFGRTYAASP